MELEEAESILRDADEVARDADVNVSFASGTITVAARDLAHVRRALAGKFPELGDYKELEPGGDSLVALRMKLERAICFLEDAAFTVSQLKLQPELNLAQLQEILGQLKPLHDRVAHDLQSKQLGNLERAWRRIASFQGTDPDPGWTPTRDEALAHLHAALELASKQISDCSREGDELLRAAGLTEFLRPIAHSLATITEMQMRIYKERPDLQPFWLSKNWGSARFARSKAPANSLD